MARAATVPARLRQQERRIPSASEVLTASLHQRLQVLGTLLRRNKRHCTERSIHDLRVAARRLMATIDLVLGILQDEELQKTRRLLRKHLKAFNTLRDTHIQILAVRTMVRRFPVLRSYLRGLLRRERTLIREARKEVARIEALHAGEIIGRVSADVIGLMAGPHMQSTGYTMLLGSLGSAFARAMTLRQKVNAGDPRSIHRLRVAFKRCRYSTEVLQPLLPGVDTKWLKAMQAYQTMMGNVQDTVVIAAGIAAHAARVPRGGAGPFFGVQQHLAQQRKTLVDTFLASADSLYGFWPLQQREF